VLSDYKAYLRIITAADSVNVLAHFIKARGRALHSTFDAAVQYSTVQ